jgi:hypothetical protein
VDGQPILEIERPRSAWEMLAATFELYRRVPLFFLMLAAIVVVPFEVIVLVITSKGPFAVGQLAFVPRQLLVVSNSFLVTPLISALHVHAVREVGEGGRPRLLPTLRRSLPTLPVVIIAAGVSSVAITAGFLALAVPGLILWSIWAVVAQTAALEGGNLTDAMRRSADLTRGHRRHALGLLFVAGLIAGVPWAPLFFLFRHTSTTGTSFVVGTALQVLLRSFEALITAVLYFDLTGRAKYVPAEPVPAVVASTASAREVPQTGDPITPEAYTDENRPQGWYVDPEDPGRMRYWLGDGAGAWSRRTAKTPKKTLAEWRKLRRSEPN